MGRDSVVDIATDYGWMVWVRTPVVTRFSAPLYTYPGAHRTFCIKSIWSFLGVMRLVGGVDHPPHLVQRRGVPVLSLWAFVTWYRVNKDITICSWSGKSFFFSFFFARPVASAPESQFSVLTCLSIARVFLVHSKDYLCVYHRKKMHTKVWTERERNLYVLNPRHKRRVFRSWT